MDLVHFRRSVTVELSCNQWTSSAIPGQQLTIQTPRNLSLKLLLLKFSRLRQCLFVCGPMTTFPTIIASCSIITIVHSLVLDVLYERETCGQHMDINNVALIFFYLRCLHFILSLSYAWNTQYLSPGNIRLT